MKRIIISTVLSLVSMLIFGQQEKKVIVKKEQHVIVDVQKDGDHEKNVTVNIDSDEKQRTITIKTIDNGDEQVITWTDDGTIPEDIKKQLEEDGIDIQILESKNGVFIVKSGHDVNANENIFIIKGDDNRELIELEWADEGDMPTEMKKVLKENDISLIDIRKNAKGKKIKMKMIKKHGDKKGLHEMHRKRMGSGPWVEKEHRMSDTYMGIQIATDENGVKILDVMVDGPAHKAGLKKGDILSELNGANTKNMKDLLTLLSFYDVNDTIELKYQRDNKTKTSIVKLAKRPEAYR